MRRTCVRLESWGTGRYRVPFHVPDAPHALNALGAEPAYVRPLPLHVMHTFLPRHV